MEALNFLIFLGIYLLNANYFLVCRVEDESYYIYSLILDAVIIIFVIFHASKEFKQLEADNFQAYFSSIWNYIDTILIVLSLITTIFDVLSCLEIWTYFEMLKVFHAFTIFSIYLRIFSFARGIEGSSFMIKLIIQVVWDIRYFLLLMFIFIIAMTSSGNLFYLFFIFLFF